MFEYSDPAGRNFLGNRKAEAAYRQTMQGFYDSFANRRNSAFTWLDAFDELSDGTQPNELTVDWGAFPLLAKATDAEIDRDRFRWQDEQWLNGFWPNKRTPILFLAVVGRVRRVPRR